MEALKGVRMKVKVNFDLCTSNGVCMGIAPEVFEVRDDGYLYVLNEEPGDEFNDKLRESVLACPNGAISLED
jgi:ferredoxin